MRSSIFCSVFILVFVKKVEPKVFILDFIDSGSEENGHINTNQLLQLLKKPRSNEFKKLGISENAGSMVRNMNNPEKSLMSLETTKTQKLQRLAKFNKEKRSFQSQPYTEFYQLFTPRPKRTIYSLSNYYGGLLKAKPLFKDLTRQEFSQDYLDISDLSRSQPEFKNPRRKNQKYLLTRFPNTKINDNKRRVFDVIQRSRSDSSDTSDSEEEVVGNRKQKKRKPKRFQVVFTEDVSLESDDSKQSSDEQKSSSIEYTTKKLSSKKRKPKIINSDSNSFEEKPKSKEKYAFLQGNRVFNDFRKRLQHFLPKRIHWDEKDIHNLGYYWYDGHIGKYIK